MNVLLVGGGGREHALGWKIAQSPLLSKLYCAPGNPGLDHIGECIRVMDHDIAAIVALAQAKSVDLVVVGPEVPLANGLADRLREHGIACFGPSAAAAQLESSKGYMKDLCRAFDIPTARYQRFSQAGAAKSFLNSLTPPYVIKADGLAAGKGVVIASTLGEAGAAIDDMLGGQFGAAGTSVVIEEFLDGQEASFFVICDGVTALPMIAAQDHKRVGHGETGPNTGGMGAYAPTRVFTDAVRAQTMDTIITPTLQAMIARGTPFVGVLFAGLMITDDGPKLIEYNVRFGDPECQVLMRLMQSDLLPILMAAAQGNLAGQTIDWSDEACANIVMAANGYPGAYQKGSQIGALAQAARLPGIEIFHAGTQRQGDAIVANGGRVLNITATAPTIRDAIARAYAGVDAIEWPGGFCRRDIGWRALEEA